MSKPLATQIKALIERDPISLMFVHDALLKQCETVLADEAVTLRAMKGSFISGPAWIAAAKKLQAIVS